MRDREVAATITRQALERDAYKCVVCYHKNNVNVHHFTANSSTVWPYPIKDPYVDTKLEDLVSLCDSCHAKIHTCDRTSPFFTLVQTVVAANREKELPRVEVVKLT